MVTLIEMLNKFADDSKIGDRIITDDDYNKIQKTWRIGASVKWMSKEI